MVGILVRSSAAEMWSTLLLDSELGTGCLKNSSPIKCRFLSNITSENKNKIKSLKYLKKKNLKRRNSGCLTKVCCTFSILGLEINFHFDYMLLFFRQKKSGWLKTFMKIRT